MSDYMQETERLLRRVEDPALSTDEYWQARAALLAHIERGRVPEGWKPMPPALTPEMRRAAVEAGTESMNAPAHIVYAAVFAAAPAAPDHSAATVRIGNAKVAVFDEAYVADLAEKAATVPAEVPMPKPVAFGVLNTALTGSPHRLMMVRIDIPSDDQYGGALWMPLVFAEDAQKYGDDREAAGYARGRAEKGGA